MGLEISIHSVAVGLEAATLHFGVDVNTYYCLFPVTQHHESEDLLSCCGMGWLQTKSASNAQDEQYEHIHKHD